MVPAGEEGPECLLSSSNCTGREEQSRLIAGDEIPKIEKVAAIFSSLLVIWGFFYVFPTNHFFH